MLLPSIDLANTPELETPEFKKFIKQTEIYRRLTQKTYQFPKGFISHRQLVNEIAKSLINNLVIAESYAINQLNDPSNVYASYAKKIQDYFTKDKTNLYHYLNCLDFTDNAYPIWTLSKSLATSLWVSEPPKKLDKIIPFCTGGVILLPQDLIKSPQGDSVNWLIFRITTEEIESFKVHNNVVLDVINPTTALHVSFFSRVVIYGTNFVLEESEGFSIGQPLKEQFDISELAKELKVEVEFDIQTDGEFLRRVRNLMVQLCLYNQLYPFSSKHGSIKKTKKLTPVMVGENYQIKTERLGSSSQKSPHWRRGHFRNQPYGSQENPQYKLIWIEPVFINS